MSLSFSIHGVLRSPWLSVSVQNLGLDIKRYHHILDYLSKITWPNHSQILDFLSEITWPNHSQILDFLSKITWPNHSQILDFLSEITWSKCNQTLDFLSKITWSNLSQILDFLSKITWSNHSQSTPKRKTQLFAGGGAKGQVAGFKKSWFCFTFGSFHAKSPGGPNPTPDSLPWILQKNLLELLWGV